MFIIVGYVIIIGCVVGGFALSGGHLGVLWQPIELLVIGGASAGAFVVGTPKKHLGATFKAVPAAFKGVALSKEHYMNLLALLYDILGKVRKEGLMSIESDIENPDASPMFQKYPEALADHHLIEFICDYLRLMVSGNLNPMEIENLMDNEIETHHHEALVPSHAITKVSDGLPAMGIVAAVLGVVHTMGLVGQPPAVLGHAIGAALVGTFMGILMSYGFVGPVATLMEAYVDEEGKQYQCVKVTLLASLNGYAPQIAVEFGRKVLYSTERPTFAELEGHVKKK
ncbi:flagellar motor stator protein MotA [Derxia lacustris]|uniref:flagellar motor stator protein MotA n=1 Tax=Derxia lacustris TaxID=764842 RepID=UPI000A177883|nr:flagellar motor stator protein MotA [Derxia lacustris]